MSAHPVYQVFRVPEDADDSAKEYVRTHMHELFEATNGVIATTPRKGDVKSLTDPAHFKQRKEPIENVHAALMNNWDDLKSGTTLFVFIVSLKHGTRVAKKRARDGDAAPLESKRRKARKQLATSEVEQVVADMVGRCGTTVAKLCAVIRKLRHELSEARAEAAAANAGRAEAAYGLASPACGASPAPSEAGEIV